MSDCNLRNIWISCCGTEINLQMHWLPTVTSSLLHGTCNRSCLEKRSHTMMISHTFDSCGQMRERMLQGIITTVWMFALFYYIAIKIFHISISPCSRPWDLIQTILVTNTSSTYIGRPVRVVSEVDRVNETRLGKRPEVKKSIFCVS